MVNLGQLYPNHNVNNVLGFDTPDDLGGRLWNFQDDHSVLVLKFHMPRNNGLFVRFEGVRYLELPRFWWGSNLKTVSAIECLTLSIDLQLFGIQDKDSANCDYLLRNNSLFVIDSSPKKCRILAAVGIKVSTEPFN